MTSSKRWLLAFAWVFVSTSTHAVQFSDDFEDGDHVGWAVSVAGAGGTNGVEFINGSKWAFIDNAQSVRRGLSRTFDFDPASILSFDLHALSSSGGTNNNVPTHSASGVTLSFETKFNGLLGKASFLYTTSPEALAAGEFAIDSLPNRFSATMAEWADVAAVASQGAVDHVSLEFWASGRTADIPRGVAAVAHVRFDNVSVSAVPEVSRSAMLAVGALAIVIGRRFSPGVPKKS